MGSKGIIHVKVEESTSYAIVKRDDYQYVECEKLGAPITAFIDDYCLDKGTVNPQSTLQSTKWIVIEEIVWDKLLAEHVKETGKQSFGDLEFFKSIPDRHILGKFNGPKAKVNLANFSTPPTPGNIYLLMPYTHYPENRYKSQNLRLVYLKDPYIRYVYVDPPSQNEADIPFGYDSKLHLYGMYAHVYISTHLLPDFRKKGKFTGDEIVTDIHWDVFFVNDANEEITVHEFSTRIENKTSAIGNTKESYNCYEEVKILIDPAWKDLKGVHQKDHQPQKYFIKVIGITQNVSYTLNPTHRYDLTTKPHKDIPPAHYNTYTDFQKWFKFNADEEMWLEMPMQEAIEVRWDTMEMIFRQFQVEINNMIQYVGDVEYSIKENNPCAYSVITINDGEKDIEIFNEFKLVKKVEDKTRRSVDIVCGEKETKTVKVTAKFLQSKDAQPEAVRTDKNHHRCEMILNNGKKHNGLEDVFKMGWILGQWVPSEDPQVWMKNLLNKVKSNGNMRFYHPSNALSAPVMDGVKVMADQDAKGIPASKELQKKYEAITVAEIQRLTPNDYKIDEESDSITLNLKYYYNKSYNNRIANYLLQEQDYLSGGILSDNVKNLWVVDYLLKWIKDEPLEQNYFVPVTTCRYPNQIARIRVFPDMKWVLNFNYNIDTPLYYKASTALETYYSGFNEGEDTATSNSNRRRGIMDHNTTNILQPYVGRKTSFGLSVECEVNGEDDVFNLGKDFAEKYRQILSPFLTVLQGLDQRLSITEANNERNRQRNSPSTNRGLLARLNSYPWSFELKPPSLGVGLGIGYSSSKNGTITYELEGRLIANPLIGASVRIDILALGSKFKPWGAIIDALDIASWVANVFSGGKVELNYDLYFQLSAEIKLVGTDSKDGEKKPANINYNFADKKYKGDIALNGVLEGKIDASIEFIYKVEIESHRSITEVRSRQAKEKAFEIGISIEAKSFVSVTLGTNFGKEETWDSDFYFSGITVQIKIKAGFNKKNDTDPMDIIPSYDKKIDIFKNAYERK